MKKEEKKTTKKKILMSLHVESHTRDRMANRSHVAPKKMNEMVLVLFFTTFTHRYCHMVIDNIDREMISPNACFDNAHAHAGRPNVYCFVPSRFELRIQK